MKSLGEVLKEYRQAKELTLNKLAEMVELSPGAISQYENQKRVPNVDSLQKLITALEIPNHEAEELYHIRDAIAQRNESPEESKVDEIEINNDEEALNTFKREVRNRFMHRHFTPDYEIELIPGFMTQVEIKTFPINKDKSNFTRQRNSIMAEKVVIETLQENKEVMYLKLRREFEKEIEKIKATLDMIDSFDDVLSENELLEKVKDRLNNNE